MSEVTQADKDKADAIIRDALKCCDDIPCRTLRTLIANGIAAAREEGRRERRLCVEDASVLPPAIDEDDLWVQVLLGTGEKEGETG